MQFGVIYILQAGERPLIKIGWCRREVTERVAELQTGNPEPLRLRVAFPGTLQEEKGLHRRFEHLRSEGGGHEWFHLNEELERFISETAAAHPESQASFRDAERARALWEWAARWWWDPIDRTGHDSRHPPPVLAEDVHRALLRCDCQPEILTKMIAALDAGSTAIPDSDRVEAPILFLDAHRSLPNPCEPARIKLLSQVYRGWDCESSWHASGTMDDPVRRKLVEAIKDRLRGTRYDEPAIAESDDGELSRD